MTHQETRPLEGSIVYIAGVPGAGKSLCIADALTYELRDGHRVVMLDATGDLSRYLRARGATDITDVSTLEEARWASSARVLAFRKSASVPLRKVCAAWLTYAATEYRAGDVLVCDEAEIVWAPGVARDEQLEVVKLARNRGTRLYVAAQRPQYTATLLRSNATHVAVFAGDSEAYVNPGCSEFADHHLFERALSLEKHHYLYRPRWRGDRLAPLEEYNALEESAPWLDDDP